MHSLHHFASQTAVNQTELLPHSLHRKIKNKELSTKAEHLTFIKSQSFISKNLEKELKTGTQSKSL